MSTKKQVGVRLTKTEAKKIISRIARGADIFEAWVDTLDLVVKCENDWYTQSGRINLIISDRWGGGSIVMCFDPDTLDRDLEAEDKLRKELKERLMKKKKRRVGESVAALAACVAILLLAWGVAMAVVMAFTTAWSNDPSRELTKAQMEIAAETMEELVSASEE